MAGGSNLKEAPVLQEGSVGKKHRLNREEAPEAQGGSAGRMHWMGRKRQEEVPETPGKWRMGRKRQGEVPDGQDATGGSTECAGKKHWMRP